MAATFFLLVVASLPIEAFAKVYIAPADEMIRTAEAIVVVSIRHSKALKPEEEALQCRQSVATAEVETVVAGKVSGAISFIVPCHPTCAYVEAKPGRYLVFLDSVDGRLVSTNWGLALRPINGKTVEWQSDALSKPVSIPLDILIHRIKQLRKRK